MQGQPYDFTIPAGGSVQIAVCGSSAKILSASSAVQIQTDTGARITAMPGQGIRNFDFGNITLINKSGYENTGYIWIADADMIDDRITGNVSIVDQVYEQCYTPTAGAVSLAVGFNTLEYLNPVANVKGAIIRFSTIACSAGVGGSVNSRIIAAKNVPASLAGGLNQLPIATIYNDANSVREMTLSEMRRSIPPGWGIWLCVNVSGVPAVVAGGGIALELIA